MRRRTGLVLCLAILGCGDDLDLSPLPENPELQADTTCLNCGVTPESNETPRFTPVQHLSVFPATLMFYGDSSVDEASDVRDSQNVLISNSTSRPVRITAVSVVPAPFVVGGEDGDAYFEVADLASTDIEARDGEVTLDVRFKGSTQQRSALIAIQTNHPSYPLLRVAVTGKTFSGFDW